MNQVPLGGIRLREGNTQHTQRPWSQTRHKDLAVLLNRYIRPLEALETTSSRDLGL